MPPACKSCKRAAIAQVEALRALLNAAPYPAWVRDGDGKLSWVNAAYARAVEAKDQEAAVVRGIELIEQPGARGERGVAQAAGEVWHGRAPAVVAGERRMLEIVDAPAGSGSAGMAADVSEIESMRAALDQQTQAHARTLDQLSTAVAIFDGAKQLVFHNAAYRQLWALDQAWLDQKPTDSEILDRLRAARLLPEQADFRAWKAGLLAAYQSLDTDESRSGFCPTGGPCGPSSAPIRKAASPISSTMSPSAIISFPNSMPRSACRAKRSMP